MSYKPLCEILAALEAQQRKELATLDGLVEERELRRVRNARKKLAALTVFFIERSWEVIAPRIEAFSLQAEAGKSTEELQEFLASLRARQPAYAWGWVRARMDAALMRWLDACVPDLLGQYPEKAAFYNSLSPQSRFVLVS